MFVGEPVFVMGTGEAAAHVAMIMLNYTDDVDLLTRGEEPEWSEETGELLAAHPVDIVETEIAGMEKDAETGWLDQVTIRHLATQTAGFAKPGGYERLLFKPGTKWHYSDGGPNWLAECLTLIYKRDLQEFMFDRVFTPLGITRDDLHWRNNAYRPNEIEGVKRREFGSGIHANVNAMARLGYLYLRQGRWKGRQLIPEWFIRQVREPYPFMKELPEHDSSEHDNASDHYNLLWWNNADGTLENVPADAHWTWGLYDSLIVVFPGLDVVVARAGKSWERTADVHYAVLKPFFEPIVKSVNE
jgi:CubicO group peptidase (beta-lactamase class C family)